MTLPASPSAGDIVSVKDYAGTFGTNNLTIGRNSSPINGGNTIDPTISTNGASITFIYVDGTKGWLATQDDSSAISGSNPYISATGGTITTCGDYKIHTFTGPGTFCVSNAGSPVGSDSVDYLVVAGGAGGGGECANFGGAGGGGAGGLRIGAVTPSGGHSPLVTTGLPVTASPYPITVGGGGSAGPTSSPGVGGNGNNSIFSSITSTGGGGGAQSASPPQIGQPGGSGGGGYPGNAGAGNTPPVSPPQGNPGAEGPSNAGGGGATAAGQTSPGSGGQSGGNGLDVSPVFGTAPQPFYIANGPDNGASVCGQFAGGGAGGHDAPGPQSGDALGGVGGGADTPACQGFGTAGTANTGGGGSGGGRDVPSGECGAGGAGGSGIVIIRYKFQ
jgi:hypothetical protein